MHPEGEICPYIKDCRKYRNENCHKVNIYRECGNYDDFKWESYGMQGDICKYIIDNLSKVDISGKKIEKTNKSKSEKKLEKCPYQLKCNYIFEIPCNYSRLHEECWILECEDCELNIPDYGVYCKTAEYEKCESYEIISTLKESYESIGIHNTEDLKEHFGEENYDWLGGYIRCAFIEPENIE